jgi:hypothetical protein
VGKFKLREELRGPSHGFDVWVTEGRNQGWLLDFQFEQAAEGCSMGMKGQEHIWEERIRKSILDKLWGVRFRCQINNKTLTSLLRQMAWPWNKSECGGNYHLETVPGKRKRTYLLHSDHYPYKPIQFKTKILMFLHHRHLCPVSG